MSSLEDRQAELQARITHLDADIAALDQNFLELASAFNAVVDGASSDSVASLKQAEQIERRLMQLRREKTLCLASQAHVTKLQLDARDKAAQAERLALQATAKTHADGVITLNSEIDEHLVKLRQLFERRAGFLRDLLGTGLVDSAVLNKLGGRNAASRAFCAAGLHRYVSLEKTATQSFVTLASTNAVLLSIGKEPPPAAVKTNGGAPPARGKVLGAEADEVPDA
jgi:hypothetical protein